MSGFYPYGYSYGAEWAAQFVFAIVAVILILVSLVSVVLYIFQAIGVHKIAKRRGLKHAWLAWIPVGSAWILGSISDQYQYVVKGRIKNRRVILLILSLASTVLGIIVALGSFGTLGSMIGALFGIGNPGQMQVVAPVVASSLASLANTLVAIVYKVFLYIVLYDLYTSCNSQNNVMFLVLGIIFSFLQPFFIFVCRNKDEGMPPRKPQPTPTWQQQNNWNP